VAFAQIHLSFFRAWVCIGGWVDTCLQMASKMYMLFAVSQSVKIIFLSLQLDNIVLPDITRARPIVTTHCTTHCTMHVCSFSLCITHFVRNLSRRSHPLTPLWITHHVNQSFASGRFPAEFNAPLLLMQGFDKSQPSSYRPISNTISKIIERLALS